MARLQLHGDDRIISFRRRTDAATTGEDRNADVAASRTCRGVWCYRRPPLPELEWAASQLAVSADSIASLAIRAGFADQSHFTRAFKERYAVTPARYRAAHR